MTTDHTTQATDRCAVCGRRTTETASQHTAPPGDEPALIVRIKPVRLVLCRPCYDDLQKRARFTRIVRRTRERLAIFYRKKP